MGQYLHPQQHIQDTSRLQEVHVTHAQNDTNENRQRHRDTLSYSSSSWNIPVPTTTTTACILRGSVAIVTYSAPIYWTRGKLWQTHHSNENWRDERLALPIFSCMKTKFTNHKTMQQYYAEAVVEHYHRTINTGNIMIIITRCRNCLYRELLLFILLQSAAFGFEANECGALVWLLLLLSLLLWWLWFGTRKSCTHFQQIVRAFNGLLFVRWWTSAQRSFTVESFVEHTKLTEIYAT